MADNASETTRSTNRLSRETSPYLLQHKENPVDWHPWGDEAFEKARREDKPVFLSIGYSSCHWCHVMEEESFENEEIAEQLNENFVSIKVDREERPDVDGLYMDFVQRATGQGGWPLSVFLFPDGRPFYGGTYFPPEDRFGRPGFTRILQTMAEYWTEDRERLEESAEDVAQGLGADVMGRLRPDELSGELLEEAVSALAQQYDASRGGFGEAPKFPQAATLSFLLRESVRSENPNARRMALHTLEQMHQGGIYDHLGGGFHRYSTDADWLVPHFEKMLYDNALLVRAYLEAFQLTGDSSYREVAEEILAYIQREMTSEEGGFYTAQDADTEGEEGKFYVWSYDEVTDILAEDELEAAAAYFDVTSDGNWEGRTILRTPHAVEHVADQIDRGVDETKQLIESSRRKLFDAREDRERPGLDDKVLTAWNGMMCTAVTQAYAVTRDEQYLEMAERNAEFLLDHLYDETSETLLRTYKDGQAKYDGYVEDYAYLAEALTLLYEATGKERWLNGALDLADTMVGKFWDDQQTGFYFADEDTELIARRKEIMDNAMPAGNSVAVHVLLRLAVLADRPAFRAKAGEVLARLGEPMRSQPTAFGYLLQAAMLEVGPLKEVALVGSEREPFLEILADELLPAVVVAQSDGAGPEASPLLANRDMIDGKTTAYVCQNYTCQQPVTDPEKFREQLLEG